MVFGPLKPLFGSRVGKYLAGQLLAAGRVRDAGCSDGRVMPFGDASFDAVIGVDMLPHNTRIAPVLAQMARVSRGMVLLKEVVSYSRWSHAAISIADWVSNVRYGIVCAYNFPTWTEWNQLFEEAGLEIAERPTKLHFGWGLTERYNPIIERKKRRG
jgi:SAM-dependent methyltransferase